MQTYASFERVGKITKSVPIKDSHDAISKPVKNLLNVCSAEISAIMCMLELVDNPPHSR